MSKANDRSHTPLDEARFIRHKLYGSEKSAFARYRELVFHSFSWPKLIRYELLTTFFGPIPGALGLLLRKRLFPSLFRKTGKGVVFGPGLTLHHADQITLGDGVMLDRNAVLDARGAGEAGVTIGNRVIVNRGAAIQAKVGHIEIGDDCNIGSDANLVSQGPIVLGSRVSVATKAIIAGGRYVVEQDSADPGAKARFSGGSIRIGDNTRIGMAAIVQDGVTIGANAIVAPGAVVYEDVPDDTVVWGNPARPVRSRASRNSTSNDSGSAVAGAVESQKPGTATDSGNVQQAIASYLEKDLFIEFDANGFRYSDSLLDSGILDSLALVRLLVWIESTFEVDLDFASLDPSEIDSVDKIARRIDQVHRPGT